MIKENRDRSGEKTLYIIGWISIIIMIVGIVLVKLMHFHRSDYNISCVFRYKTGYYCPGCGGTRAVKYFLQGHWIKSFIYHPLVPYLGIGGGIYMISHTLYYISQGRIQGIKFRPIYAYLMLIILFVQFIIKNAFIYFYGYYIIG